MELVITNGYYSGGDYKEVSRFIIKITDPSKTRIKEVLELAKQESQPPYMERLKDYFYLMHPDSKTKLDESKTLVECNIQDKGILRLMCSVR
ncbi:MAG: hypothetical protein ACXADA_22815 [Candidatus Hodarchaeales archaeon]|jgi:hypothetical protein